MNSLPVPPAQYSTQQQATQAEVNEHFAHHIRANGSAAHPSVAHQPTDHLSEQPLLHHGIDHLFLDILSSPDKPSEFNLTDSLNLSNLPPLDQTFAQHFDQAFGPSIAEACLPLDPATLLEPPPPPQPSPPIRTGSSDDSKQSKSAFSGSQRDGSNDSPHAVSARESRLAKKRLNQKHYRQREKLERQQATARLAELETLLTRLSVENTRLKWRQTALQDLVDTLDRVAAALVSKEEIVREHQTEDEYLTCVKTAQNMTLNEFREIWRRVVNEGADLLMQIEAGSEEAYARLESRCATFETFLLHLEIIQPVLCDTLSSMNLETGAIEDPGMEFWMQRVQGMGLTDEQLEMVDDCVYADASKQLEDARRRILENVKKMVDQDKKRLDVIANRPDSSMTHVLRTVDFNAHPVVTVPALERILHREGLMGALVSNHIWSRVFNAKQKTSIVVSMYPYMIRDTFVIQCVKAIRNERIALGAFKSSRTERQSR